MQHYEFERARDVHELSMMKRAMGGFRGFDAMSPTVLLKIAAAAIAAAKNGSPHLLSAEAFDGSTQSSEFFSKFDLSGEAIPFRSGLASGQDLSSSYPAQQSMPPFASNLTEQALSEWPPTFVM